MLQKQGEEDGRLLILHQHFVTLVCVPSPLISLFQSFIHLQCIDFTDDGCKIHHWNQSHALLGEQGRQPLDSLVPAGNVITTSCPVDGRQSS